jgi:hypothetical protein
MNDRDEPASADLDAWFASERGYQEVPGAAVRAHLLAAIQQRVAGSGGGGSGGGEQGAATMATSKAVAGMIATFVVGGLVGAAVMHGAPASAVVATSMASEASAPSAAAPLEAPAPLASAAIEAPITSAASVAAKPPSGDARGAAAERALVDAARIALASGEPSQALDIVERHVRDYPQGRLVEEREAIAIRALVKAGRYDEARERGARFQARYARSVAAPAVSAALRSIPEAP